MSFTLMLTFLNYGYIPESSKKPWIHAADEFLMLEIRIKNAEMIALILNKFQILPVLSTY